MKSRHLSKMIIKTLINLSIIPLIFFIVLWGCSSPTDSDKEDNLYVKFINDVNSLYVITNIQLQAMGIAGDSVSTPSGTWSENILEDGKTIAPGNHEFFTLDIPNQRWSQYRLGVDDGNGNEIMFHLQEGYESQLTPSITHWGSAERTVSVHIIYDQPNDLIYITGYSDWAGID